MRVSRFLHFCLFLAALEIFGLDDENVQCKIGNFALPASQQPGAFLSFGENIINQNQVQLFLYADDFIGNNNNFADLVPGIVYGITDAFSVFFNVPVAPSYKNRGAHSAGFEDLFIQFEYAIFSKQYYCASDQVTIVANASFPTGSSKKTPPTGFGAMAYFLGVTYNRTWSDWFVFTSYGAELPTSHDGLKFGNQYLYQFGFGRNIKNINGWLFAWMTEINGAFYSRDRIHGVYNPNSGGNRIYVTPSLWASSKDWIFQLGFGFAVQQNLFGNQTEGRYLFAFNGGRTF